MEKVGQQALELLKVLAEKVGTTVEGLYPYLVKQAYLSALLTILGWTTFVGIVMIGSWRLASTGQYMDRDDKRIAHTIIVIVGAAILSLVYSLEIPNLLNPNYTAIHELLSLIKK